MMSTSNIAGLYKYLFYHIHFEFTISLHHNLGEVSFPRSTDWLIEYKPFCFCYFLCFDFLVILWGSRFVLFFFNLLLLFSTYFYLSFLLFRFFVFCSCCCCFFFCFVFFIQKTYSFYSKNLKGLFHDFPQNLFFPFNYQYLLCLKSFT